jgi:hypothetical protein
VVLLDDALAVLEDDVFFLHHVVRRQATFGPAQAHRTARRLEAHPQVRCSPNLGVNGAVVWVEVEVIGRRGAAGQDHLSHADKRRGVDSFLRQLAPDGV